MAIDMTTVKQIMRNNKEVAKIEDGLGNILWQKQSTPTEITIDYTCLRLNQYLPASKTVQLINNQYTLTAADIPSINLGSTSDQIVGWTVDGSTQLQVGDTISTNVTLKAIHKITVTKTYDWTKQGGVDYTPSAGSSVTSGTVSHTNAQWNLQTSKSANATWSYKKTWSTTSGNKYYTAVSIRGFTGIITTTQVYPNTSFKIHWSPAVTNVTYARTNSYTMNGNYGGTYPMILVRDGNTTTRLFYNNNVSANYVSDTITAGSSANGYISFQYGGWASDGTLYASWARQNRLSSSSFSGNVPTSNQTGNKTDYIYLYQQ